MATDVQQLLERLDDEAVQYILIGGIAVILHGHPRFTADLDLCYARTPENGSRLVRALAPTHPRLRGAPPDLPFIFDERTLKTGLNFTLVTDVGEIDLLGEVTGVGGFADLEPSAAVARTT